VYSAWFEGPQEGSPEVRIAIRFPDQVRRYIDIQGIAMWNPVLISMAGRLWIFFKAGKFCDCWQTFFGELDTNSKSSKLLKNPGTLPAGLSGPVKFRPIIKGNDIICGSSTETHFNWTAHTEVYRLNPSTGQLAIISRSFPLSANGIKGIIQPAMWEDDDGFYNMLCRSSGEANLWYSRSREVGNPCSWDTPIVTGIANPNSAADVIKHSSGKLFSVLNPSSRRRAPLALVELKKGDGVFEQLLWDSINIEDKVSSTLFTQRGGTRELSYPYMIENSVGNLLIGYTYGRRAFRIAEVEV
jgi:predicted neuraminidase